MRYDDVPNLERKMDRAFQLSQVTQREDSPRLTLIELEAGIGWHRQGEWSAPVQMSSVTMALSANPSRKQTGYASAFTRWNHRGP